MAIRFIAALLAWAAAVAPTHAATELRIGYLSTLSGPAGGVGGDIRDGFALGVALAGGKLGGLPTEVIYADDQLNPEIGKQLAERLVKRDRANLVTGVLVSNVLLAAWPVIEGAKLFYVAPNATPTRLSGKECSPRFFSASWPNEAYHEAAGQYAKSKGYRNAFLVAPNYPAGQDATNGFKRGFGGGIAGEVYPKLNQLDFAAEIAQIRAAKPDLAFVFLPGGMAIQFFKQYFAAGLAKDVPLIAPGFTTDQEILRAVGDPMLGIYDAAHWSIDLDNDANRAFVAAFEKAYGRLPSGIAEQGYTTALVIDAAVRAVNGNIEDEAAFRAALKSAPSRIRSPRGPWTFANNGTPVQDYFLRVVAKDAKGRLVNRKEGVLMTGAVDNWAKDCPLK